MCFSRVGSRRHWFRSHMRWRLEFFPFLMDDTTTIQGMERWKFCFDRAIHIHRRWLHSPPSMSSGCNANVSCLWLEGRVLPLPTLFFLFFFLSSPPLLPGTGNLLSISLFLPWMCGFPSMSPDALFFPFSLLYGEGGRSPRRVDVPRKPLLSCKKKQRKKEKKETLPPHPHPHPSRFVSSSSYQGMGVREERKEWETPPPPPLLHPHPSPPRCVGNTHVRNGTMWMPGGHPAFFLHRFFYYYRVFVFRLHPRERYTSAFFDVHPWMVVHIQPYNCHTSASPKHCNHVQQRTTTTVGLPRRITGNEIETKQKVRAR